MTLEHDTLATVATVASELEGQLLVNILNEHGIRAVATGGYMSQFRAEAPGMVRVLVTQDNLSTANSILAERKEQHFPQPTGEDSESSDDDSSQTRVRFVTWGLLMLFVVELVVFLGILVSWLIF